MNRERREAATMAYAAFFETLTRDSLGQLDSFLDPRVRFVDPFSDVVGLAKVRRVFARMFDTLVDPRFVIEDIAVGDPGSDLRWSMRFADRQGDPWCLTGMTELQFSDQGRIVLHRDHCDAASQFYEHLPVIGALLRLVRRRVSGGHG